MKAVILAAGEGVRLLPLTATRPKHLIRLGGKSILENCLDALKICRITEVIIITHYMSQAIKDNLGDGSKFGFKITYVEQEALLGTGNAASMVEQYIDDDFLLIYGDLLFSAEAIKKVFDSNEIEKNSAVIGVVAVDNPEGYGIIELDSKDKFKRIVEKPKPEDAPSNLANAGLYLFSKEVFDALRHVKRSVRGEWELTDAVTLLSQEGKKVAVTEISKSDWFDIGRPWDLLEANAWVLKRMQHKVLGNVENGAHLIGPVTVAETARIRSGAYVEGPCFIDEGADVGPNCYIRASTSIGKKARVGNACEVKNTIIMEGTHVGHLSYVGDSILCNNCNLGAGTITANLRFDDGTVKMLIKDKVVDTKRRKLGVVMGDNVKTGVNSVFMPGVKVGNDCWIGANCMIEHDLPPKTVIELKQSYVKHEHEC